MSRNTRGTKPSYSASASPSAVGTPPPQALTADFVQKLILQSEKRILCRLDDIDSRISSLESRLDVIQSEQLVIQSEQVRVSSDLVQMRETVIQQQNQIEKLESAQRASSLVVSCVPESDVVSDTERFTDDLQKVKFLCSSIVEDFDSTSIVECYRLGNLNKERKRPIKVTFKSAGTRNTVLRSQRRVREVSSIKNSFGLVFINPDRSRLVRLEEKRLRDKMRELKSTSPNSTEVYIRAGKLFVGTNIVDRTNVGNQLF